MSRFESIDVTRLRWFVAVADELHFARAAKSLNITRQKLSHTVIELEAELETKLFVPGAQSTQLTEDGAELLRAAREIIAAAADHSDQSAEDVALRIGFVPGVTVSKWTRIWGERFPEIRLDVIPIPMKEQLDALRDGRVDGCFVRLPIDRAGLSAIPLYRELPVVVVPKDHTLSVFEQVGMAELADDQIQDSSDLDTIGGAIELVAAGVGVVIVPHSIARLYARKDLVYRTMMGVPETEIALAWPSDKTTELIEEFVGIVRGRSERSTRTPTVKTKAPQKSSAKRGGSGSKNPNVNKKQSASKGGAGKKPAKRRGH